MAERKPLFMGIEGYAEEMSTSDSITLGSLKVGGNIDLQDVGKIVNLATPTETDDAATKGYVDAVAQGLVIKAPVKAVATSNISSLSGLSQTVDGVALDTDGYRVLLTAQTTASQNGIWVVHSGAWTRPADFNTGDHASGAFCFVEQGTTYADTGWVCTTDSPNDVIGTNNLAFVQFSAAGVVEAGNGLTKTGNTIDVGKGDGIAVGADAISVDLTSNGGLTFTGTSPNGTLGVLADTSHGISVGASGVAVKVENDGAIVFDGTNGGLEVNLQTTNPALAITSNMLDVKYQTSKGLASDTSGLYVKVDGTSIGYDGSGQLYAIGSSEAQRIENTMTVVTGGSVAAGDPVYITSTANRIDKGDTTDAAAKIIGVSRTAASGGATCEVVTAGICAGILTGATAGTPYYLATGGGLSTSLPGAGKRVIQVGIALNATDLFVRIVDYGKKAA